MNYPETVRYLLRLGNELKGGRLGLERIDRLLDQLGRPERAFESVHIAGTNGKGSTAAMIEAGLLEAGFRTGLYTSPHLVRINERFRTDGRDISDAEFCEGFAEVRAAVERLLAAEALDAHPTYFECVTALAFRHFRAAGVERAVVEVGLGGRLDATNVLDPRVSVLTPIDLDHEAFLGRQAEAIAAEKAGILKPGATVVSSPQRPEVRAVLRAGASRLNLPWVEVGQDWLAEEVTHVEGCYRFVARRRGGPTVRAELALAGKHQVTNALTAIAALDALGVAPGPIERGLRAARWPGRLEILARDPLVLLDGAHNPAGARALACYLRQHQAGRRVWLIWGAMRDKAVDEVAGILFPLAYRVLITPAPQTRAVSAGALADIVSHHHRSIAVTGNLAEALRQARDAASASDLILVTGSLFLVGEAKQLEGS